MKTVYKFKKKKIKDLEIYVKIHSQNTIVKVLYMRDYLACFVEMAFFNSLMIEVYDDSFVKSFCLYIYTSIFTGLKKCFQFDRKGGIACILSVVVTASINILLNIVSSFY